MRNALFLMVAWLLIGCAGRRSSSIRTPLVASGREVTNLSMLTGHELPRAFQRVHDDPGWKWVLWSNESLCVVDSRTWTMTHIGDHVRCDWRAPRG